MKRKETIQIMVTADEKQIITEKAHRANTDVSKFIRTTTLTDGKVVFLDKGGYIPRNLIEINDKVKGALRDGKISDSLGHELLAGLKDIMTIFVEISQQLTIINNTEEEGD